MNAIAERPQESVGDVIEKTLLEGDLSRLTPEQRVTYYHRVCDSLGLNPLTKPFDYLKLNGKLQLYARKDCTDQLRKIHGVSVIDLTEAERADVFIVTAKVEDKDGRRDAAKGAVTIKGLVGDALANAIMKAETKAKRRATLSICGLGMLDELEVETITGTPVVQPKPEPEKRLIDLPSSLDIHRDKLERAGTIDALKTAWDATCSDSFLTTDQRKELAALKDQRKTALSAPQKPERQPGDDPPEAEQSGALNPDELAWILARDQALDAMKSAKLTWSMVVKEGMRFFGRQLSGKTLAKDLTREDFLKLKAVCDNLRPPHAGVRA